MKQENTEQPVHASGLMKRMSESTFKRVEAGPFTACIKRIQLRHDQGVRSTFSLEVHRTVRVGETTTKVPSFDRTISALCRC